MKILYIAYAGNIHTYKWVRYFSEIGNEIDLISFKPDFGDSESLKERFSIFEQYSGLKNVRIHFIETDSALMNNKFVYSILKYTLKTMKIITIDNQFSVLINPLSTFVQIDKIIKNSNPDVIHGHVLNHILMLSALTNFHPFIISPWGSDILIYPKRSRIIKAAIKFLLMKADLIVCAAENIKEEMIMIGANEKKIRIILHGVDTTKFKPYAADDRLKMDLNISNCPVIISTRRLKPIYDVETLLKAIPRVLGAVPSAKFILASDGELRGSLINLAETLNIRDAIRFIGFIPNDEVPRYLATSDIYVSTSLSDDFPVSTLEAMACGVAIIATDVGSTKKWVIDGENGFVIPVKNSEILADKIIYLLKNESVRKKFGRINRKLIESKADYYREMEKMEKCYIQLVSVKDP